MFKKLNYNSQFWIEGNEAYQIWKFQLFMHLFIGSHLNLPLESWSWIVAMEEYFLNLFKNARKNSQKVFIIRIIFGVKNDLRLGWIFSLIGHRYRNFCDYSSLARCKFGSKTRILAIFEIFSYYEQHCGRCQSFGFMYMAHFKTCRSIYISLMFNSPWSRRLCFTRSCCPPKYSSTPEQ